MGDAAELFKAPILMALALCFYQLAEGKPKAHWLVWAMHAINWYAVWQIRKFFS